MTPEVTSSQLVELLNLKRMRQIEQLCEQDNDLISSKDCATLINPRVSASPTGDVSVDDVQAALKRLKKERPYLTFSGRSDHGVVPGVAPAHEPSDVDKIRKVMGPGSDGAAANRLAMANPAEYRRLKKVAQALRII